MKKITTQKGSITLFTLIAMMFFLTISFTAYASAMAKLQAQNDDLERIKASYEQDLTEEGLASLYEKLTKSKTLAQQVTSNNYGDFIDYGIDISNNDEGHINGWKIFYKDANGNVFIIAADSIRNDNKILENALAKANMGTYTTNNSKPYSAYWPNASFLTKKDSITGEAKIDSNVSSIFMFDWQSGGMAQPNKIAIAALLDAESWKGFVTDGATMAIGGPTIEMYRASWNEKKYSSGKHTKIQIAPDKSNLYGYFIGVNDDDNFVPTTKAMQPSSDEAHNDKLYFPHEYSNNNWNGTGSFWMASPSAIDNWGILNANYGAYFSGAGYMNNQMSVRPVICLPSTIKATWNADKQIWIICN